MLPGDVSYFSRIRERWPVNDHGDLFSPLSPPAPPEVYFSLPSRNQLNFITRHLLFDLIVKAHYGKLYLMLSSNFPGCTETQVVVGVSRLSPHLRSAAVPQRSARLRWVLWPVKAGTKIRAPPHELFIPPPGLQGGLGRQRGGAERLAESCAWLGWNFLE